MFSFFVTPTGEHTFCIALINLPHTNHAMLHLTRTRDQPDETQQRDLGGDQEPKIPAQTRQEEQRAEEAETQRVRLGREDGGHCSDPQQKVCL